MLRSVRSWCDLVSIFLPDAIIRYQGWYGDRRDWPICHQFSSVSFVLVGPVASMMMLASGSYRQPKNRSNLFGHFLWWASLFAAVPVTWWHVRISNTSGTGNFGVNSVKESNANANVSNLKGPQSQFDPQATTSQLQWGQWSAHHLRRSCPEVLEIYWNWAVLEPELLSYA